MIVSRSTPIGWSPLSDAIYAEHNKRIDEQTKEEGEEEEEEEEKKRKRG
jgi:hypothetical protein